MTVDELKQWRRQERARLIEKRQQVPREQHRRWNEHITALLLAGFPGLAHMVVGFCWPFKGEFDARFAIREWRRAGATAGLPAVVEKNAPLEFREWWPGAPVRKGVFDLPVPEGTAVLRPQALLIPPVGFDAAGFRLGYGGGYFDRTLAALQPSPLRIGVAFELSRIPTIHPQPHDVPLDFIVTEAGVHHATQGTLIRLPAPGEAIALVERLLSLRGARETTEPGADAPARYASPACYAHEFELKDDFPSQPG